MIADLLNTPRSRTDWSVWSHSHALGHGEIRQAILAKYNVQLGDYVLDPINFDDVEGWLGRVQQTHDEMNGILGLSSTDLEGVDVTNPNQLSAWVYLNWQEDNAARVALGI